MERPSDYRKYDDLADGSAYLFAGLLGAVITLLAHQYWISIYPGLYILLGVVKLRDWWNRDEK